MGINSPCKICTAASCDGCVLAGDKAIGYCKSVGCFLCEDPLGCKLSLDGACKASTCYCLPDNEKK